MKIAKFLIKDFIKTLGIGASITEKKIQTLDNQFISEKEVQALGKQNIKVLFTHSLSTYEPSFIHDKLISYALRLRGIDVMATYCNGIQENECNVNGGVWCGGASFSSNCKLCQLKSKKLWSSIGAEKIFLYSDYLHEDDFLKTNDILKSIPKGQWQLYTEGEWEFGKWAKDILVNNYVVADYKLIDDHEKLGRSHLKNLILQKFVIEKIIDKANPDRIISNDSFYGMWKIWELMAKNKGIDFYSHWSGTRVGAWAYAYNDASMKLDFSKPWVEYSKIKLSAEETNRVTDWLKDRESGKDMIIDTASMSSYKNEGVDFSDFDSSKPTALLSANVVWDLAALNKEVFSASMSDWIISTVKWFKDNPQFQLVIKAHPAEFFPGIPETKETVESMLFSIFDKLPTNVFFVSPKASISVYELVSIAKVGLVFTTSVGMEMAARGVPVVTAGISHYRGYNFTYDPETEKEYHDILYSLLSNATPDMENSIDLAYKFIKFNFFHYYSRTGLIEFGHTKGKNNYIEVTINDISELKKGNNINLDYIMDAIEKGLPILDVDRWMGES